MSDEEIEKIVSEWLVFHHGNTGMTENNISKLIKRLQGKLDDKWQPCRKAVKDD